MRRKQEIMQCRLNELMDEIIKEKWKYWQFKFEQLKKNGRINELKN
jgi:hypothetical protein